MSKDTKNRSKGTKMMIDIFAGTIAGINVTLVGHPFDTLKVRLQTQPHINPIYNGLIDCFKKTVKWEGFFNGLYIGVQSSLVGQIFFRANMFLAFGEAKRFFSDNGKKPLNYIHYFIVGGIGWGFGSLAECPIDFFKTQMQIQIIKLKTIKDYVPEYTSTSDCFSKIIKMNGLSGAYQGFISNLLRNICGGSVHLGSFEVLRIKFAEKRKCSVQDLPVKFNLIAGSVGGIMFWGLFYPLVVIKSCIQGDSPLKEKRKYNGILDVIRKLYSEGGPPNFYKGFSPCMLRSIPANAVLLFTSSFISEHL